MKLLILLLSLSTQAGTTKGYSKQELYKALTDKYEDTLEDYSNAKYTPEQILAIKEGKHPNPNHCYTCPEYKGKDPNRK
jgi:hypothetical protein